MTAKKTSTKTTKKASTNQIEVVKEAEKPARGRPRVTKLVPERTRSVTLPFDLWQLIGVDAEKEIRSANGQLEWIIRKHYNYYGLSNPAHEPDLFKDDLTQEEIKAINKTARESQKRVKEREAEKDSLIQNLDKEAEHLFEENPLTPQMRKDLAKEKRASKKKAEEVRKFVQRNRKTS